MQNPKKSDFAKYFCCIENFILFIFLIILFFMTISQECDKNNFDCGADITLVVLFVVVFLMNLIFFIKSLRVQKTMTYELVAVLIASIDVIFSFKIGVQISIFIGGNHDPLWTFFQKCDHCFNRKLFRAFDLFLDQFLLRDRFFSLI